MSIYADSSFFVSLYLPDQHSLEARRLARHHARIWLTPLHRAECAQAIALRIFQREISAGEAQIVLRDFEQDRAAKFWIELALPEMTFDTCIRLTQRFAGRLNSGTLDTLHVASALELGAERFWTFDERQAKLARAVGLKTG